MQNDTPSRFFPGILKALFLLPGRLLTPHLTWQERALQPSTSKLLTGFMAVFLAFTPWMEVIFTWDHFPVTGRDYELGIFCFFAIVALAVLLARSLRVVPVLRSRFGSVIPPPPGQGQPECAPSRELPALRFPIPLRI